MRKGDSIMAKKRKLIILSICMVFTIAVILSQIVFPLSFSNDNIEYKHLVSGDMTYFKYGFMHSIDDPQGLYQRFTEDKELPSYDPNDYARINYTINCNSHSIFKVFDGSLSIKKLPSKYAERCLYSMTAVSPTSVERFRSSAADHVLFVYVKGLSEEEIKEIANGFEFALTYKMQIFGSKEQGLSIIDDNITAYVTDEDFYAEYDPKKDHG